MLQQANAWSPNEHASEMLKIARRLTRFLGNKQALTLLRSLVTRVGQRTKSRNTPRWHTISLFGLALSHPSRSQVSSFLASI
jgi:hypothetical protein